MSTPNINTSPAVTYNMIRRRIPRFGPRPELAEAVRPKPTTLVPVHCSGETELVGNLLSFSG
jgi:hypothetical protein